MNYYPVFVDLRGKRCLVVGGGEVASRKVDSLIKAGGEVIVVAPELSPALAALRDAGSIQQVATGFRPEHLDEAWLVIAATDDVAVNRAVSEQAPRSAHPSIHPPPRCARRRRLALRHAIGMVTQDTSLLHRAMRDNILYGRPDATEAQMLTAAKRAQADEFIDQLTDLQGRRGYEAHVGERGVKLSGGQRQRVAIARVMLKDAPVLLLDEATSALDSEVEAAIQESLQELMKGKTVIAIAHRLSTIAALDRLIVLDAGRVVEEGTHAQLLARGGIYAGLWARQSGGFLGEQGEDGGV